MYIFFVRKTWITFNTGPTERFDRLEVETKAVQCK